MRECHICGFSVASDPKWDEKWNSHLRSHLLRLSELLKPATAEPGASSHMSSAPDQAWLSLSQLGTARASADATLGTEDSQNHVQPPLHASSSFAEYEAARRAKRRTARQSKDSAVTSTSTGGGGNGSQNLPSKSSTSSGHRLTAAEGYGQHWPEMLMRREQGWRRPSSTPAPLPSRIAWEDSARGVVPCVISTTPLRRTPGSSTPAHHCRSPQSARRPSSRLGGFNGLAVNTEQTVSALATDRHSWEPRALKLIARHVRQSPGSTERYGNA